MLMLSSALSSLPAPVNVCVKSVNFRHELHWEPGPGTPSGAQYMIFERVNKKLKRTMSSTKTSFKLKLKNETKYCLAVRTSYNQSQSPESLNVTFTPYSETKISSPELSLAGCGNCIQINISLPKADRSSKIKDIQEYYDADFRVLYKKGNTMGVYKTKNKTFTLGELETGAEYCIQVHTESRTNKNMEPSAWKCTLTSIVEPSTDSFILGAVAALLIGVTGFLMTFLFCLCYTGFLCKLKAALPRALITALSQGSSLTPEKTTPDLISINSPTTLDPASRDINSEEEEDEDDEEEEGINIYIDRDAELSSGGHSCQHSGNMSGSKSADSRCVTERLSAEVEAPDSEFEVGVKHRELNQHRVEALGATVSFVPEHGQTGVHGQVTVEEEEEKQEVCYSSSNVNLFSVTLSALAVGEEEEQNTRDSLKLSEPEPLLPTVSKLTLSDTDSKTESGDQTAVTLMQPTHEDFSESGYERRHVDT